MREEAVEEAGGKGGSHFMTGYIVFPNPNPGTPSHTFRDGQRQCARQAKYCSVPQGILRPLAHTAGRCPDSQDPRPFPEEDCKRGQASPGAPVEQGIV